MDALRAPLAFTPVYQPLLWGGRRMEGWRDDLPAGAIGESWDIADHPRGMSVVAEGPLAGTSLRALVERDGLALIGDGWDGGTFPLMVKLIDAADRLSVQVHPDDALARQLGVGERGKTECWMMVADGGELYVGTAPGVTRARFEEALAHGALASTLNRFAAHDGDCYFLPARTVHALGRGCLLYEVQQTCDVTFRVDDWGRVGADGKPRPLHRAESLATIDWAARSSGALSVPSERHPGGGSVRHLVQCPYFSLEERRAERAAGGGSGRCSIVIGVSGTGRLSTAHGEARLTPMRSLLVPAAAGPWQALADPGDRLRLLIAHPG